jgi:hypothetical protein
MRASFARTQRDQQGFGARADAQLAAIAFLADFTRIELAQRLGLGQRRPIVGRGFQRQQHDGRVMAAQRRSGNPRADFPHGDDQVLKGQANRHIS